MGCTDVRTMTLTVDVTLVVVAVAMALGSLAKAATGLGLPIIAISVMAPFVGVENAVLVMAVPTFVTNGWLLWEHRDRWPAVGYLRTFVALGALGTVAGTILLTRVDGDLLSVLLGGMVTAYLALRLRRPEFRLSRRLASLTAPLVGLTGGMLQGATGVSGPVITTYIHCLGLPREAFIVTLTAIFQAFALMQIATFAAVGLYDASSLGLTMLSLVPVLAAFPLGLRLGRRMSRQWFERLVLALLAASAGKLLVDGISGLA